MNLSHRLGKIDCNDGSDEENCRELFFIQNLIIFHVIFVIFTINILN